MGRKKTDILDAVNWSILREIQRDPKAPLKELGQRVGLMVSALGERIARLEEEGILQGYRAVLQPVRLGYPMRAIIALKSNSPADEDRLEAKLASMKEVQRFWNVTGENDFFAECLFTGVEHLDRFLDRLNEHAQCQTSLVIRGPFENPLEPPDPPVS